VKWEETADEGVYQAAFPNYTIRLSSRWNGEMEGLDYFMRLYNENGTLIEEISDEDFHAIDKDAGTYKFLAETYESARRIAMGVEQALDDLLRELDDNLPF
jgi:hypothetical protein